jgi:hypothetical protein
MRSQRAAQADEARHARIGFHLASHYGRVVLGPGPLKLRGALEELSFDEILLTTFREGCIGETRASLEMARAAEHVQDPALRRTLSAIAEDEVRHAELAWRGVSWMLTERPELGDLIFAEVRAACQQDDGAAGPKRKATVDQTPASSHGMLSDVVVQECRAQADREVIWPCTRRLLSMRADLAPPSDGQGVSAPS